MSEPFTPVSRNSFTMTQYDTVTSLPLLPPSLKVEDPRGLCGERGAGGVRSVLAWELRYCLSIASNRWLAAAAFFFFVALLAVRNTWGPLIGTSALGQLAELVYDLLLVFGVILPFLVADRVAHDQRERMHELLMACPVSTRAYVWGRWLAALGVTLGLALLLLAAQVLVNGALTTLDPAHYPSPNLAAALTFWALLVLPAGALVCGLCFGLGSLWPRVTALPKLAACLAWVILAFDQDPTDLSWRAYWNPTGAGMITLLGDQYQKAVQAASVLSLQQAMPNLQPWLGPFLALAVVGLLLGLASPFGFRRFQESLQ
jgi:hypothetical protein